MGRAKRFSGRAMLLAALSATLMVAMSHTSGAMAAGACPNEALRSELHSSSLPDCRAYEMVTPPYMAGFPIEGIDRFENGSFAIGTSLGGFAETGNDELSGKGANAGFPSTPYEFVRGGNGWETIALSPPASVYGRSGMLGLSGDGRQSIWGLPASASPNGEEIIRKDSLARAFYLRTPAGEFVRIGPATPPTGQETNTYLMAGLSSGLTRLVYTLSAATGSTGNLWPGDTSIPGVNMRSLYEYDGTGGTEPRLVGVSNEGRLDGTPAVNEGAQLLSQCGIDLGSGYEGSGYNAVSATGATVFFTARHEAGCLGTQPAVDEVYARIDGEHTVAISEPPLTLPGRACTGTCESAETTLTNRGEAVFQGASEEGSKVFFTTEQPLVNEGTDTSNDLYMEQIGCPAAKPECKIAEREVISLVQVSHDANAGQPADVQGVVRISADGSRVYFVARGVLSTTPNARRQLPVNGGENLYVYEPDPGNPATERTAFIGTLQSGDQQLWGRLDNRAAQTSLDPGGRWLVFASTAPLTADDTSSAPQLFEFDSQTGALARVSIGQGGFNQNGNVNDSAFAPAITSPEHTTSMPTAGESMLDIANDGTVVFTSADGLTPQALNRLKIGEQSGGAAIYAQNVYEYRDGDVYLISDGQDIATLLGQSTVSLLGISPSGRDVFFETSDSLIAQDTNSQVDVYDARSGGGFAGVTAGDGCAGEECRGPLSAAPNLPVASGSATQPAGGNLQSGASPKKVKPKVKPKRKRKSSHKRKTKKKARRAVKLRGGRR